MKRFYKLLTMVFAAMLCLGLALFAAACDRSGDENKDPGSEEGSVEYRIDVYLQNISGTSYAIDLDRSVTGKGKVGEAVPVPTIEHFTENAAHAEATPASSRILKENASENNFKFYYDREQYTVKYDANAPAGVATGSVAEQSYSYESSIRLAENGFTLRGYRFAGWATEKNGEPAYQGNDRVKVTGPLTLYAVWDRGYTDRLGGTDVVYFPRGDEELAVLSRGGHEFEGTRNGNSFTFDRPAGEISGMVFGTTFSYENADLAGEYVLYDCTNHAQLGLGGASATDDSRINDQVTLEVDEYLNATYTKNGVEEEGSLSRSERGDYLFTSENDSFYLLLNAESGTLPARFSISGDEAGVYAEGLLLGGGIYISGDSIVLDGYGNAVLYRASGGYNLGYDGYYTITGTANLSRQTFRRIEMIIYDPIGALGGAEGTWVGNSIYTFPALVSNEMGEANGYVQADVYAGKYEGEEGTLTLDGMLNAAGASLFDDSATFTPKNGTPITGSYTYTVDYKSGLIVTLTEKSGAVHTYQAHWLHQPDKQGVVGSVNSYDPRTAEEYVELYRVTSQLDFPLLYLYPETSATGGNIPEGAKKAELWAADEDGDDIPKLAGEGYYIVNKEGGKDFYTFTLTSTVAGYTGTLPTSLKFFTSGVYSSEDNRPRGVYCVLEENGNKLYTEYTDTQNNITIWANSEIALQGVGSLMRKGEGDFVEGSATLSRSINFDTETLTFLYAGENGGAVQLLYTVTGENIVPAAGAELGLYYYLFIEETQSGRYVQDLILDGTVLGPTAAGVTGKARFHTGYGYDDEGSWQMGTYEYVGSTDFGDDIFELTVGGNKIFKFVLYIIQSDYVYFRYDEALEGTFNADDGGKLVLDGFFYGSYTDKNGETELGSFSYNPVEKLVFFTMESGDGFYCRLEGGKLTVLDSAFGSYLLIDGNYNTINNATIEFDGQGGVTVSFADGGQSRTGTYTLDSAETNEYIVVCNFGTGMTMPAGGWHVRLFFGAYADGCIVYDPEMVGTFFNDEWDVLYLDGFGTGSLYADNGAIGGTGDYTVMDAEKGLMYFTVDEETDVSIRFDREQHTFEILDFSDISYLYLADDFDYIVFTPNGVLRIGNLSGMYFTGETAYYGFLYSYDSDGYSSAELPVPGDKTYTYGGKTYTLQDRRTVTLTGTIQFYDKAGSLIEGNGTKEATLMTTLALGANYNLNTTITVDGKAHTFTLNPYTEGRIDPRLTYDGVDYDVDFTLGEENQFTVKAGWYEIVMNDFYSNFREETGAKRGGKIIKEVVGFGPIELQAPTYSGEFYYHNNETPGADAEKLTFSGVTEDQLVKVGYRVGGLGDCYEVVFTSGGKTYAIDFYESFAEEQGPVIVLQGFYTYEEFTDVDGFAKVGVKYLVASTTPNTAGYGEQAAIGKPYSVTLYKDVKGVPTPVVCYDTGVAMTHTGDKCAAVWLGEFGGLDDDGDLIVGRGYYVSFTLSTDPLTPNKVTAVTVKDYKVGQALAGAYLINYFIDDSETDEQDKPVLKVAEVLAVAYTDGSGYYWLEDTHDLAYSKETDTWTFYGTQTGSTEKQYTLTFTLLASGSFSVLVK